MPLDIKPGDTVRLKKQHPCGSYEWRVVRLGADIGIRCLKCQRRVLLPRSVFESRVKALVAREQGNRMSIQERKRELEARLADLKARWPKHSVPPSMWLELEEIEEELERLEETAGEKGDAR